MWSRACARLEEAERRHRKFFDLLSLPARAPVWEPPVDVFVLEGAMHIVVALPAVSPTSATVELTPRGLLIRAESRPPLTWSVASTCPPGATSCSSMSLWMVASIYI
jgi:HSP20 family molecular chaperone IbpA